MYNRYIQNDRGRSQNSPLPEPPPFPPPHHEQGSCDGDHSGNRPPAGKQEKGGLLSSLFGRFKLDDIDTGDLLLIAVIILLFKESEDEELLIALVLLLIL